MKVEVTRATLGDLSNMVGEAENVDIVFADNILAYTPLDFQVYRDQLMKIAGEIITAFKKNGQRIAVNVLTDILSLQPPEHHDYLLFCKHCPCFHCKPDQDLFREATGDLFIPPWQYCEKAFIELEVTRHLIEELKLNTEVSDIDRVLFEEYIDLLYGTYVGREVKP
jgi:hypothetical protein